MRETTADLEAEGGESLLEWSGDPIFLRVEPAVVYTYAKEL